MLLGKCCADLFLNYSNWCDLHEGGYLLSKLVSVACGIVQTALNLKDIAMELGDVEQVNRMSLEDCVYHPRKRANPLDPFPPAARTS
jgi:hypothetical protein